MPRLCSQTSPAFRVRESMDGGGRSDHPELHFESVPGTTSTVVHPNLQLTEHISRFTVRHNLKEVNILDIDRQIDEAFGKLAKPIVERAEPNDLISVRITHLDLTKGPIFLTFLRSSSFSSEAFTNRIYEVSQSNTDFLLDGEFEVAISVLRRLSAGAPPLRPNKDVMRRPQTAEQVRHFSKSIVQIVSEGNECGYKAVYFSEYRRKHFNDPTAWRTLTTAMRKKNQQSKIIDCRVKEFVREVNASQNTDLDIRDELEVSDLEIFARHLGVRIVVVEAYEGGLPGSGEIIFKSSTPQLMENHFFLELLHRNGGSNHYNVITSITGYLKTRAFCYICLKKVSAGHSCECGCNGCNSPTQCMELEVTQCERCGHECASMSCLFKHMNTKKCTLRWKCQICEMVMPAKAKLNHKCAHHYCIKCNTSYKESPHYCFMQPKPQQKEEQVIIVAFDIESMVENINNEEVHVPNLLCSMTVCSSCYEWDSVRKQGPDGKFMPLKKGDCSVCKTFVNIFPGESCVKDFGDYIYNDLAQHAARLPASTVIRVFAHNLKSYDGRFILRDFFKRDLLSSRVIMQGTKVTCFDVGNVRFQDSLNLFMCALRKLPDTFKFSQRVKKGEFPHGFNRRENQSYQGQTPPLSAYGFERMKPGDQQTLKSFHDTIKDRTDFDFQNEIRAYCLADVEVLLISVQEFRNAFIKVSGFDPIQNCFTLPSMSFATYRSNFLKENEIGITPITPYGCQRKSTMISDVFFDFLEANDEFLELRREWRLGKHYADAFDPITNTAYEFNGCYYHGCDKCYPNERDVIIFGTETTMNQRYSATMKKLEYYDKLRQAIPGLTVKSMWECEFELLQLSNPSIKQFVEQRIAFYRKLKSIGHIDLRETYFGGRTENARFFKECDDTEWFEIVDFCSLYPAVISKYEYMKGHPDVINSNFHNYFTENGQFSDRVFGFVKCKVLPPKQMTFPILPGRFSNRLEFVLCRTCAEKNAKQFCTHSDDERALVGSFATPELREALQNGYQVMEVYEILNWRNRSCDLFHPFVRKWIKIKTEATGFPDWVRTEEDKDKYIRDYFDESEILLDKESIRKDPVLRAIAKNQLNSFYGKFAQRPNMEQCEIVKTHAKMYELASDPTKEITGMITVDTDTALVNWKFANDTDARNGNVNVAIASFITSYARRELWRSLNAIESRSPGSVYYFDTDSIFYLANAETELLPTGPLLGDLTREIGDDEDVKKLVILGPKNYAYTKTNRISGNTKVTIKVKGITLDSKTLETINIEAMEQMCKKYYEEGETVEKKVEQHRIHSSKNQMITNRVMYKVYRAVSEKRLIVGNETFPKGYVSESAELTERLDQFISFLESLLDQ